MKNHYIQAILETLQSHDDIEKVFEGLRKTMQENGHMRLYAPVLRGVLRVLETKKSSSLATVIVAKDADIEKYAELIKTSLSSIEMGDDFLTEIDETIIGGVIVKNNNHIVDNSYKTVLTNLYRSVAQ